MTRPALQDSSTGVLYGATSESFVSSTNGYSSASQSITLGGTDATFMLTFQLPAMPPSGGITLFQLSMATVSNNNGPSNNFYNIYVSAMAAGVLSMFSGPGAMGSGASSTNNIGGYISVDLYSNVADSVANTTTTVMSGSMMGPPPFLYVPRLFGGSWVTVAVSVSSTGNMTAYARDSVLSSSLSLGASSAACASEDLQRTNARVRLQV